MRERVRTALRWAFGVLMIAQGVNHFVSADFFVSIMPPYLPWHLELVYASGVAEIAIGAGVLVARTRRLAAWGAFALLVAVFPANIHMALHPESYPTIPPAALWVRLPLQAVFFAWVWWTCLAAPNEAPARDPTA